MVLVHWNLIGSLPFMSLSCDCFFFFFFLQKKGLKIYHLFTFPTTSVVNFIHIHNTILKVPISKYECPAQSYFNARYSHSAVSLIYLIYTSHKIQNVCLKSNSLIFQAQTHKYTWIKTYLFTSKPSRVNNTTSCAKSWNIKILFISFCTGNPSVVYTDHP